VIVVHRVYHGLRERHGTRLADRRIVERIPERLIQLILGHDALTAPQVRSIARIAYLAAEIDLDEDVDERAALDELVARLWRVAGLPPEPVEPVSPLPLPRDDEERHARVRELTAPLVTRGARELAYAVAYVLVTADIELDRLEARLLDELQQALEIDDVRAADLAAFAAEAITPGIEQAAAP
jgi:hypothetical protein